MDAWPEIAFVVEQMEPGQVEPGKKVADEGKFFRHLKATKRIHQSERGKVGSFVINFVIKRKHTSLFIQGKKKNIK